MKRKEKLGKAKRITISLRQYYYLALLFPLVFPPFLFFPLPETNKEGMPILFYLVVFGIIQYVIFMVWSLFKYRGAVAKELQEFSYLAPFYFIPFYAVGFILGIMLSNISPPGIDMFLMMLVTCLLSIPVGYCYVTLAHIIGRILEKIGFIEKEYL
ncbi:MAG: hypothetical protein ABL867_08195 [Rickettsiales bacterium]